MNPVSQGQVDPVLALQQKQDAEHLSMLGIFWKIYAVLAGIGACLGFFYLVLGAAVAASPGATTRAQEGMVIGGVFVVFGIAIILLTGTVAALCWLASVRLGERRGITLCTVMAALACINMPFGTALGVFTLIVLARPTVKALFS